MKKRSYLFFVWIVTVAVLCTSCGWFSPQRYVCEVDEVESVQIVRLDRVVEYEFEYTVLAQVEDRETFVTRLMEVKHSVNWGDPVPLPFGVAVIKINYLNGEYDLIHSDAQVFECPGNSTTGFFFFDDEQFDALISEYWVE